MYKYQINQTIAQLKTQETEFDFLRLQHFLTLIFKLGSTISSGDAIANILLQNNIGRALKETLESEEILLSKLEDNPFTDTYRRVTYEFDVCLLETIQVIFSPGRSELKSDLLLDLHRILYPENHTP